ncbi:hypothetical protein [Streptomyces iconiensis]|uniref:Uncharacterized protein n=1 Tax=Streptomyces iconiensis TaxID=1384038 RepID=A0ABT7A9C1_9ACTN|nr:hypothetical protein [Streptomyces iconiensis]MDJ1137925.1 hypothetical protein [Streptomyces iconiensis]
MIHGPLRWYEVAERLRAAVHDALTDKPQRSGVVPGAIAWDECDCGLLAVSVGPIVWSDEFPDEATTRTANCNPVYEAAEIIVQVARCAPSPQGQDMAPTVAALDAAAQAVARDAYETRCAVLTALVGMVDEDIRDYFLRPQTPQGPAGGCVGTELRVSVAL